MSKKKSRRTSKKGNGYVSLVKQYKAAAAAANAKLNALRESGKSEFNMQMVRKWNTLLKDKSVKYVNTKTGKFMASPSNKVGKWMSAKELRSAIATLNQFTSSRYTSVEYTSAYTQELMERLGVSDEKLLKDIFRVFREFGFAGRWDSGHILSNIAEWSDRTGRGDLGNLLENFIDEYNENLTADTPPVDTTILANHISDMVANLDDFEEAPLTAAEMDEIARLRSLSDFEEPEPATMSWDDF